MLLIEWALVLLALMFAFGAPTAGSHFFQELEDRFAVLARKRRLSVLVVGLTALALRAALLPIEPIPEPGNHDEFSYLLAADTFSHGRLANPTHLMWKHFETFHVIQRPSYVSKFPPAQGLLLAIGEIVFGHPFWGVWLSVGAMCAAICWMLQGWLTPEWALLGGFLATIRLGAFSYWANSYWGGSAAAIGGALLLGALPRILRQPRKRDSLLMTLGCAILANSRPYEGLILSVCVAVALLRSILRKDTPPLEHWLRRVAPPVGLVALAAGGAMCYYFWRTTGSPFLMPYAVYQRTYDPIPTFPWSSLRPVSAYNNPVMRSFYLGWPLHQYELARSHPLQLAERRLSDYWFFYLGPALSLPLVMSILIRNRGRTERSASFLLITSCVFLFGLLLPVYFEPHYAAPACALLYALVLLALQRLRQWRRERGIGLFISRAVPAICVVLLALQAAAGPLKIPLEHPYSPKSWRWDPVVFPRAAIREKLMRLSGRHLVLVRYPPGYAGLEWVYNGADLDSSRVVWARDMGPDENEELIEYFKDRAVWLLDADETSTKLSSYKIPRPSQEPLESADRARRSY
jgi:hypothetical protein